MRQAIQLADETFVQTLPNPKVACLLVDADGAIVGSGVHGTSGLDHAEVIALRVAGDRAKGSTAYVTLEPCAHQGKTGPCVDALHRAGVSRVVFAVSDPTHGGQKELIAHQMQIASGVLEDEARIGLAPWLHGEECNTPFVTLKVASTLDGYIAAQDGTSKWITSVQSRLLVQQLRLDVDAIVTSTATMREDNPHYTIREYEAMWQPHIYVMGKSDISSATNIAGRSTQIKSHNPLDVLLQATHDGRRHLLVEAGGKVAGAFLKANLVNRILWISAPTILGDGVQAIQGLGARSLKDALRAKVIEQRSQDEDFLTVLQTNRCSH